MAISTYALNWINYSLSSSGNQYALVIIGALLVLVMLFFPKGIVVTLATGAFRRGGWRAAFRESRHDVAPILATERLSKRFGGVVATDNVTLEVPEGDLRCIIGPNGAGKSTLFALLCGMHRPDSGRIFLKGHDMTRISAFRRVRLGVGLTFQTNRAFTT